MSNQFGSSLRKVYEIEARGRVLALGRRTLLMGVLNVTPDSFFEGGRYFDRAAAVARGLELEAEGADIIDVGGESTRPGAEPVPLEVELERVVPVVAELARRAGAVISIDTYKAEVARRALDAGAAVINDVSGLEFDPEMTRVVAESRAALIIMHMRGTPQTMRQLPPSADILGEVLSGLERARRKAEAAGVARERIILDPGLGFGKNAEENLLLLNRLDRLAILECPLAVGPSRKSFIGKVLGLPVGERLWGTAAAVAVAILRGAHIVRVHDVAAMRQVAAVADAVLNEKV